MNFELQDWCFQLVDYALYDILSEDSKEATSIRNKAAKCYYNAVLEILYRKSYDSDLLCFLSRRDVWEVVKETHDGTYGAHQLGPKLWNGIRRLIYFWLKIIMNMVTYAKYCHA